MIIFLQEDFYERYLEKRLRYRLFTEDFFFQIDVL